MRRFVLPAFAVFAAPVPSADAVGFMTQLSCASDYYAYCSKHEVGSPGLRKCMNDNGPRLSSSCINALISDGEVSKEEVARRREQYLASKSPKTQSKVASKATVAPKQIVTVGPPEVRAPLVRNPQPTDVVLTSALVLDQKTYLALKNRGDRFVIEGDFAPSPHALANNTASPTPEQVAAEGSDAASDVPAMTLPIAATVPPVAAAEALDAQPAAPPAKDMPGKMALGKKPSAELPPPPPVVEEVLAPRKPSSAEIWMNYMQNRFDGGMNYEGVDANF